MALLLPWLARHFPSSNTLPAATRINRCCPHEDRPPCGRHVQPGKGEAIKGIVFDCDGVLVDSERLLVVIDQYVFAQLGWEASIEEITRRFVGKTEAQCEIEIQSVLGPLPGDWREPYTDLYERALREDLTAVPGVEAALREIALPKAVASNSPRATILRSLSTTALTPYFHGRLVGADDVDRGKPCPDSYLRAAELLGLPPSECLAVEDSPTGVVAARAAGMRVLGFGGGLSTPQTLLAAGADVFHSMSDLPALVESYLDQ